MFNNPRLFNQEVEYTEDTSYFPPPSLNQPTRAPGS